ncbi:uncharacterized protein LOC116786822 [Chiroxiphia lanceolata]|uniref:uncharacterized protein LOC116786822 n=1 Tax=Chiroxiphia lanceolata TaxID=296741 RepID=UPI0013CEBA0B|nr:uncharacterized protein LOC116786822 [Chiroxiphia lanceolata]
MIPAPGRTSRPRRPRRAGGKGKENQAWASSQTVLRLCGEELGEEARGEQLVSAFVTASVQDGAGCPWRGKGVARPPRSCDRVAFLWGLAADQAGLGGGRLPGTARASLPSSRHHAVGPALVPFPHQPCARGCSCCRGRFSLLSLLSTHLQGVAALGGSFPFRPLSAQGFTPASESSPWRLLAPPERGSRGALTVVPARCEGTLLPVRLPGSRE